MNINKYYLCRLQSLQIQIGKDLKAICGGHMFFHD